MKNSREIKKKACSRLRELGYPWRATFAALLLGGTSCVLFLWTQALLFMSSHLVRNSAYPGLAPFFRWAYLALAVYLLVSALIGSFVELGYERIFIGRAQNSSKTKEEIFYCRPIWKNALLLRLLMSAKTTLWTILLIVPGIRSLLNYSLAPYLMAQNPTLAPPRAIFMSKYLMKGYRKKLLALVARFIPELILCGATLGVGLVFVLPRIKSAVTEFYRERVALHDNEIRRQHTNAAEEHASADEKESLT